MGLSKVVNSGLVAMLGIGVRVVSSIELGGETRRHGKSKAPYGEDWSARCGRLRCLQCRVQIPSAPDRAIRMGNQGSIREAQV